MLAGVRLLVECDGGNVFDDFGELGGEDRDAVRCGLGLLDAPRVVCDRGA